jgi:hypothetical protein
MRVELAIGRLVLDGFELDAVGRRELVAALGSNLAGFLGSATPPSGGRCVVSINASAEAVDGSASTLGKAIAGALGTCFEGIISIERARGGCHQ